MFSSFEVIERVLKSIGVDRKSPSEYFVFSYEDGKHLRLRLSWHGIFLQNYFDQNKEIRKKNPAEPKLNVGQNLAITFAPNKDECRQEKIPFPYKIKNVTKARTEFGNNVKPQFSVRHICYKTWILSEADVQMIIEAIRICIKTGNAFIEPLGPSLQKVIEWIDTSNLPPKRIIFGNS